MKNLYKILNISFLSLFLGACGGGSNNNNDPYGNYTTTVIDNSKYAWHVSTNLDTVFKTNYFIDDNAHINIASAWTLTKGKKASGEKIRIAIIDEDFEVEHPDLKGKIYKKYNVMNDSENITNTSSATFSHGTGVAGFIASDYLGVSPDVELILINIDLTNSIPESKYIKAFEYAKSQGAKIINCSWGGANLTEVMSAKLKELYDANINVVFAAGNEQYNLDLPSYNEEAESPYVIAVGSSTIKNDVGKSSYGSNIDLIAPGGGGKLFRNGKIEDGIGVLALDSMGDKGDNNTYNLVNNNYTFTTGSSFSTPIVSGTIALMLAVNPNLTPSQIRTILINTAQKVGGNIAKYDTNGFDTYRAYGKVDTGKAVEAAANAL